MSKNRNYHYTNSGSHGTMVCACCNKPITEGEDYRYYQKHSAWDWAYVVHHRACCADDAGWVTYDRANQKCTDDRCKMLAEAIAFRDKWNVDDLDELIADLE